VDVIVEFSGWMKLNLEKTLMQYVGEDSAKKTLILAKDWVKLSAKERSLYLLDSFMEAQEEAHDYELVDVNFVIEN
jgi:hypothetical protein